MNISISLPPELLDLAQAQVDSGRYGSISEVVGDALRLLDKADLHSDDLIVLRRAWEEGIASDDVGALDFAELRRTARQRLEAERKL